MKRNAKLFYKIADEIESERNYNYNQTAWATFKGFVGRKKDVSKMRAGDTLPAETACRTAFCVAGHAVIQSGKAVQRLIVCDPDFNEVGVEFRHARSGRHMGIFRVPQIARVELGLNHEEADILFDEFWKPKSNVSVSDALRAIGDGATVDSVTRGD